MKIFIIMALLSSNVFAGSFIKVDEGSATWSLNVKKQTGTIVLTRHSSGTENKGLTDDEQIKVTNVFGWLSSLGTIAKESAIFENTDERSQETVSKLIKKMMLDEMSKLNIEVKDVDINFEHLNCKEKGFIKKQLNCQAQYKSRIDVEFK